MWRDISRMERRLTWLEQGFKVLRLRWLNPTFDDAAKGRKPPWEAQDSSFEVDGIAAVPAAAPGVPEGA